MKQNEKGYFLESTQRQIDVYGAFGFSLLDSEIRTGYDNDYKKYNLEKECVESEFNDEEKKEIAKFVIEEWAKLADLKIKFE